MIRIVQEPGESRVWISVKLPNGEELWFDHVYESEAVGNCVRDQCRELLGDKLASIRREAYEKGWKDAKAKRRKSKYFFRFWNGVGY